MLPLHALNRRATSTLPSKVGGGEGTPPTGASSPERGPSHEGIRGGRRGITSPIAWTPPHNNVGDFTFGPSGYLCRRRCRVLGSSVLVARMRNLYLIDLQRTVKIILALVGCSKVAPASVSRASAAK